MQSDISNALLGSECLSGGLSICGAVYKALKAHF